MGDRQLGKNPWPIAYRLSPALKGKEDMTMKYNRHHRNDDLIIILDIDKAFSSSELGALQKTTVE